MFSQLWNNSFISIKDSYSSTEDWIIVSLPTKNYREFIADISEK